MKHASGNRIKLILLTAILILFAFTTAGAMDFAAVPPDEFMNRLLVYKDKQGQEQIYPKFTVRHFIITFTSYFAGHMSKKETLALEHFAWRMEKEKWILDFQGAEAEGRDRGLFSMSFVALDNARVLLESIQVKTSAGSDNQPPSSYVSRMYLEFTKKMQEQEK